MNGQEWKIVQEKKNLCNEKKKNIRKYLELDWQRRVNGYFFFRINKKTRFFFFFFLKNVYPNFERRVEASSFFSFSAYLIKPAFLLSFCLLKLPFFFPLLEKFFSFLCLRLFSSFVLFFFH